MEEDLEAVDWFALYSLLANDKGTQLKLNLVDTLVVTSNSQDTRATLYYTNEDGHVVTELVVLSSSTKRIQTQLIRSCLAAKPGTEGELVAIRRNYHDPPQLLTPRELSDSLHAIVEAKQQPRSPDHVPHPTYCLQSYMQPADKQRIVSTYSVVGGIKQINSTVRSYSARYRPVVQEYLRAERGAVSPQGPPPEDVKSAVHDTIMRLVTYLRRVHGVELQTLIVEHVVLEDNSVFLNGFLGCEPNSVDIMAELVIRELRRRTPVNEERRRPSTAVGIRSRFSQQTRSPSTRPSTAQGLRSRVSQSRFSLSRGEKTPVQSASGGSSVGSSNISHAGCSHAGQPTVGELTDEIEKLKEHIASLELRLVQVREETGAVQSENKILTGRIDYWEQKIKDSASQCLGVQSSATQLEDGANRQCAERSAEIQTLESQLQVLEKGKLVAEREYAQLRVGSSHLENERIQFEQNYNELRARSDQLRSDITAEKERQSKVREDAVRAKEKYAKTNRQNQFLQRHLEIRKGAAPAWYNLGLDDLLDTDSEDEMMMRELIMKYDVSLKRSYAKYCNKQAALSAAAFKQYCTECHINEPEVSFEDIVKVFGQSVHRGNTSIDDVHLEYHEFVEATIRIAALRYGAGRGTVLKVVEALNAFIHNNFRFGRGGTNLEAKESKISQSQSG